jgi:putative oxidoreductase
MKMPTIIKTSLDRLRALADKSSFVGPTLARLTLGVLFIGTGWGKLHALPDLIQFFTELHIPAPGFQARLVAMTELVGGLMLLLGLGARLASVPLLITMIVAILTAKRSQIDGLSTLLGFEEWSYLIMFLWIAVAGPGPLSLDRLLSVVRRRLASRAAVTLPKPLLRPLA